MRKRAGVQQLANPGVLTAADPREVEDYRRLLPVNLGLVQVTIAIRPPADGA